MRVTPLLIAYASWFTFVPCTTPLALAAVPVMTLGLWLKARVEDQFLSEELGAATYGRYKDRTPMLVPRLSRGLAAGRA